jgi:hypothetical protein
MFGLNFVISLPCRLKGSINYPPRTVGPSLRETIRAEWRDTNLFFSSVNKNSNSYYSLRIFCKSQNSTLCFTTHYQVLKISILTGRYLSLFDWGFSRMGGSHKLQSHYAFDEHIFGNDHMNKTIPCRRSTGFQTSLDQECRIVNTWNGDQLVLPVHRYLLTTRNINPGVDLPVTPDHKKHKPRCGDVFVYSQTRFSTGELVSLFDNETRFAREERHWDELKS